ncbi:MAG TPA: PAS domain S-box protein [Hanamia sp.]|jgi:PAS domain S-box-containing protein|nr:PAS domain S-box protein [Hanamia sp.]
MLRDKNLYNILIVEDNPGDFMIVDGFLREQILKPFIVHAENYKQALSQLSGPDIAFDVILLDLSLPDKSGQNLISEILFLAPSCPIIVLTGYGDIEFSIKSISQGIYDYLLKDELNATSLYKSIIYSIERKRIISELKSSEKRASDLFNYSPQPMMVYDPEDLQFIQVNKAAIDHYGYSDEEFVNLNMLDLIPEKEILKSKEILSLHKQKTDKQKEKFNHQKKSGEFIEVELFFNTLKINGKDFRSVIVFDVTERNIYEKKIMKAIIKTQEDERYEIGAELHDNVCQLVATSQLSLSMLKGYVAPEKMDIFNQSREYLSLVLDEIRNLSHRLAPAFFDDSTLEEAFSKLLNTFNPEGQYEILLHVDDAVKNYPLSLEIQVNLYRILQEQLRNIQKYAKAGLLKVDVLLHKNILKMTISDDGIGFNINSVKSGIGLANIKRRIELFSGNFQLESSPGVGCNVLIDIPLQEMNELPSVVNAGI